MLEQNATGLRQETSTDSNQKPECSPLNAPAGQDPSRPYMDKQETTSCWKSSDRTENGHRESEGTESRSRAVQMAETKTPNGVSNSTVEEVSSQVTSKTVETSQDNTSRLSSFTPSLFSKNGSFPVAMHNVSAQQAAGCTVEQNSGLLSKKEPDLLVKNGTGQQLKPYVNRQETVSQSRSSEKTAAGRKETESQQKKSDAVLYSVAQTPATTVINTGEEKSFQSSFSSNGSSSQPEVQSCVSTPPAPGASSNDQDTETGNKTDSSAKTFLQSISNYLFSLNGSSSIDAPSSAVQGSEVPRQPREAPSDVSSAPDASGPAIGAGVDTQKQSVKSEISTTPRGILKASVPMRETTPKGNPNIVPELKTTNESVKQGLSQTTTEMVQAVDTQPLKEPMQPAVSVDEKETPNYANQVESTSNKQIAPRGSAQLSSVTSWKPKVDFKTGLSFFRTENQAVSDPTQAQAQPESRPENRITLSQPKGSEKIETGFKECQSTNQPALKINTPACFAPKSWAPVKSPVPVVKTVGQTAPLQQECSITSSDTGELRETSTASSCPARSAGSSQAGSDVTDQSQVRSQIALSGQAGLLSGHGPVSAAPFPGRKTELKPGDLQPADPVPSQNTAQSVSSGTKLPGLGETQMTSSRIHPLNSGKSEATERQKSETLSKSSEALHRPIGQSLSHNFAELETSSLPSDTNQVTSAPYVDQQETVNKSKMCEITDKGRKESAMEERRKYSVQQSHSRTPTKSSATTVEEESTHTVSQSNEIIRGVVGPQDQPSLQEFTTWSNGAPQHSDLSSKIVSPFGTAPSGTRQASNAPSQRQTGILDQQLIKSCNESQVHSGPKAPFNSPMSLLSNVPFADSDNKALQNLKTHPPCVDKQETFSHSKISEKTSSGHRDAETAEKKRLSHEQSVSRTPTTVTSTKVDEQSCQTLSQTKETSGYVTMPMSRSASLGPPSNLTTMACAPQAATLKLACTSPADQRQSRPSTSTLSKESSEHQVMKSSSKLVGQPLSDESSSSMHQLHGQQQQQQKIQPEFKLNDMLATKGDALLGNDFESRSSLIVPQPPSHSQPFVDKQETFSKYKTSEKTKTGTREVDVAEKNQKSFQQSFTRSPSVNSSTTTEEQCFQTTFQSHETSKDQALSGSPKPVVMIPDPGVTNRLTPASVAPAASKQGSATVQRTRSVDQGSRTAREHVIPIQLTAERSPSTTSGAQLVQRQSTAARRQREHIIPVQLSPFPERRAFLEEASAGRRYSVSVDWPASDWTRPVLSTAGWHPPDWTRPDGQQHHQQQPVFCCPVVQGGPRRSALVSLYAEPPLAGPADRA